MAHVLIMPRQGNTVESCIIVEWKVQEGDRAAPDTVICEVETDKASFEVPAGSSGTVLKLLYPAGEDVPVLKPIAVIGDTGEDWAAALGSSVPDAADAGNLSSDTQKAADPAQIPVQDSASAPAAAPGADKTAAGMGTELSAAKSAALSPRARHLASRQALSLEGLTGSGPGGRIIERDVKQALESRPALTAAGKTVLGAGNTGTELPPAGSGFAGRITAADAAAAGIGPSSVPPAPSVKMGTELKASAMSSGEGAVTETPIKGIRKLIADRMFQSLAESAQFTLQASAPASRMQSLRARMKASAEDLGLSKITINDLVLFMVSRLLPHYPYMNAHKSGDMLRTFERVHLGVAVDTPRGLMVPVIRSANLLSLEQISSEAKRLAAACQGGNINPDELSGSTFTVTNLGSLGVSAFTPVINAPEVAILGVCAIELKPMAASAEETEESGWEVKFEPHLGLSLTINHEAVDGAPAARFLKALGDGIRDIDLWLAK